MHQAGRDVKMENTAKLQLHLRSSYEASLNKHIEAVFSLVNFSKPCGSRAVSTQVPKYFLICLLPPLTTTECEQKVDGGRSNIVQSYSCLWIKYNTMTFGSF